VLVIAEHVDTKALRRDGRKRAFNCRMRFAVSLFIFATPALAQFQTTAPLVLAPVTITDSKGRYIDGLTASDLTLYDNDVVQTIQLDWDITAISLVVAVETSANARPVIDKLGSTGILLSNLLAGAAAETAMLSYGDVVTARQDFTRDPDPLTHALRMLQPGKSNASALDAIEEALRMLEKRPPAQRRIILMIGETRDRGSRAKLEDVARHVQRANATIYWLGYSAFLQPFTAKPRTREDLKPEAERISKRKPLCLQCPDPDDRLAPDDRPMNLLEGLAALGRLHQPDLADLFARTTGGRSLNFLKKSALEDAIQAIGQEAHRQYLFTFQPAGGDSGEFHTLRIEVKGRLDLHAKTREGYWS
jgi:VWFA-related protein